MHVTESGIVIPVKFEQQRAFFYIFLTELGMVTFLKFLQ